MPPKQEDQEAVEYYTASHNKYEYLCIGSTQNLCLQVYF